MTLTHQAVAPAAPASTTPAPTATSRRFWHRRSNTTTTTSPAPAAHAVEPDQPTIARGDPLLAHLLAHPVPQTIDALPAFSPAVRTMRASDTQIVVPLVASGELVGLVTLGERRSERGYSRDDLELLERLAQHAAPALRVGNLVRQQEIEARSLQRIESELQVAQLIQQQFLPSQLPAMDGWQVDAYYRPARTVGGDFYDVVALPDGRIMVVTGDVTDKGVPAALVMASTHALLRAAARSEHSPGQVLGHVNDLLHPQIPPHMFVTCLVLILDPATGATSYANAGHNLPYLRRGASVSQLDARGMPLGLMPGSAYDEHTTVLEPGDVLVLYSDGITEQHDRTGQMFGFARMAAVVAGSATGSAIVDGCMDQLKTFHAGVEQEDDITLVALTRPGSPAGGALTFAVASVEGNEREAMDRVLAEVGDALSPDRAAALGTAVAEATMNAIEHGNAGRAELTVEIALTVDPERVRVAVTDHGHGRADDAEIPDLELKLAGLQSTRGWGLFLIEQLADEVTEDTDPGGRHTVTITMLRTGGQP